MAISTSKSDKYFKNFTNKWKDIIPGSEKIFDELKKIIAEKKGFAIWLYPEERYVDRTWIFSGYSNPTPFEYEVQTALLELLKNCCELESRSSMDYVESYAQRVFDLMQPSERTNGTKKNADLDSKNIEQKNNLSNAIVHFDLSYYGDADYEDIVEFIKKAKNENAFMFYGDEKSLSLLYDKCNTQAEIKNINIPLSLDVNNVVAYFDYLTSEDEDKTIQNDNFYQSLKWKLRKELSQKANKPNVSVGKLMSPYMTEDEYDFLKDGLESFDVEYDSQIEDNGHQNDNLLNTTKVSYELKNGCFEFILGEYFRSDFTKSYLAYSVANRYKEALKYWNQNHENYYVDYLDNHIIGQDDVKCAIKERIDYFKIILPAVQKNDIPLGQENFNFAIFGQPGTGKTTIANTIIDLFGKLGIVDEECFCVLNPNNVLEKDIQNEMYRYNIDFGFYYFDKFIPNEENSNAVNNLISIVDKFQNDNNPRIFIFSADLKYKEGFFDNNDKLIKHFPNPVVLEQFDCNFLFDYLVGELKSADIKIKKEEEGDIKNKFENLYNTYCDATTFSNLNFASEIRDEIIKKCRIRNPKTKYFTIKDFPDENFTFKSIENVFNLDKALNGIIGLENVKSQLRQFESFNKVAYIRKNAGFEVDMPRLHMVFKGNPGTGKTTVARLLPKILFNLGILKSDKFKETTAADFIGPYIGHTQERTKKILEESLNGVLFIDEAYSLVAGSQARNFGIEAINEILAFMENHRDEIVIIFAGYPKEMDNFLSSNPGLKSRIGYTLNFDDYNKNELLIIFKELSKKDKYILSEDAESRLSEVFEWNSKFPEFGNGRFVAQIYDNAVQKLFQSIVDSSNGDNKKLKKLATTENLTIKKEHILSDEDISEKFGLVKRKVLPQRDNATQKRIIYHELGHAICNYYFYKKNTISEIVFRSNELGVGGYVSLKPGPSSNPFTKTEFKNKIVIAFGGIAAEKIFCGEQSAGPVSDLQNATELAVGYVARFGMSDWGYASLDGYIRQTQNTSLGFESSPSLYLPEKAIDEVNQLLNECEQFAENIIMRNFEMLIGIRKEAEGVDKFNGEEIEKKFEKMKRFDEKEKSLIFEKSEPLSISERNKAK